MSKTVAQKNIPEEIRHIAAAVDDKKGENLVILNVAKQSTLASWFVFCSGQNNRQNATIAEEVEHRMRELNRKPLHREGGRSQSSWLLLDYGDIIVHIFIPETREFYDLESLWGDAPHVNVEKLLA